MSQIDWETSPVSVFRVCHRPLGLVSSLYLPKKASTYTTVHSLPWPSQLQKHKTYHAFRQQTWTSLVDKPTGRPKQTFRGWNRRATAAQCGYTSACSLHHVRRMPDTDQTRPLATWHGDLALPQSCRGDVKWSSVTLRGHPIWRVWVEVRRSRHLPRFRSRSHSYA